MHHEEATAILRAHADELRERGVSRLALFGSVLREDADKDSAVDLLVDLDLDQVLSLIDFADLRLRLCDILGRDVDLALRNRLKPHLREAILAEAKDVL